MSEDSKFGFKDKAKAEETIELLKSHELQYQRLTVRGLLGRAKRVLTMTKAEEKIKNINEAINIFEKWLEDNGGGASNKNTKTDSEDKVETVPGLGFKDRDAAEKTLKILEGRDPDYQRLAVKGLIGSSKRVLSGTKNEDKIKAIKAGVGILEDFLEKFEKLNLIKENKSYLPLSVISGFPQPKDKLVAEFIKVYGSSHVKGNYKHLRTLYPEDDDTTTWDIVRNNHLKDLNEKIRKDDLKLFTDSGEPTKEHLKLIYWAFSPQPDKVRAYLDKANKKSKGSKAEKRKSSGRSGSSEDDSPKKSRKD